MSTRPMPVLGQKYNILIIEDFPSWQKSFKRFLRNEPFNVILASTYQEALQLARAYSLDVIILDINLSGVPYNVDGLRLADQIWQRNQDVQIIIVSGSREWQRRLQTCNFSPSFILEKRSLDQDDLVSKIYWSINRRSNRRAH